LGVYEREMEGKKLIKINRMLGSVDRRGESGGKEVFENGDN